MRHDSLRTAITTAVGVLHPTAPFLSPKRRRRSSAALVLSGAKRNPTIPNARDLKYDKFIIVRKVHKLSLLLFLLLFYYDRSLIRVIFKVLRAINDEIRCLSSRNVHALLRQYEICLLLVFFFSVYILLL